MRSFITATIMIILIFAIPPASVEANPFQGEEYVALHIAEAYWGGRPPLCRPLIKQVVPESVFAAEAREFGERLTPGEIINGAADQPQEVMRCELEILEQMEWPELCVTMVHEVGHLWGLPHSKDPSSPMYPSAGAETVSACTSAVDPGPAPPLRPRRH